MVVLPSLLKKKTVLQSSESLSISLEEKSRTEDGQDGALAEWNTRHTASGLMHGK